MSEKITLRNSNNKIKGIKLNEILEISSIDNELINRQKEIEIELHNHFVKGFKEGQKEALNRLQKEYSLKLEEAYSVLDSLTSKLESQINEQIQKIDEFVLQLSFQIAEKIIRREIEKNSPIIKIIDEALKKLTSANDATIKLHPADYDLIQSHLSVINKKLSSINIRFESDERIEKGGCLIETEIGNADGRIKSQIENLKHQLENYLDENNA